MPMTKEERRAYNKAYREKNKAKAAEASKKHYEAHKEEVKEKSKVTGKKKLAEETPEQRAARLERQRAYNKQYYAAGKAKKAAKKAEEAPKPKKAEEAPKPEPKPAPKKVKGGFIQKHEGETEEEIKARVAHNKAHFKKLREAKAAREKEDAEAKARAETADMEGREREKETRAKILTKKEEPAPAVREVAPEPEPEPEPPKTEVPFVPSIVAAAPKPEPAAPPAPPVKEKPKGKRELAKEAKQAEAVRRLTEMAKNIEKESHRRDVESSMRHFDKLRREAGLPKSFYYDALGRKAPEVITISIPPSAETTKRIELDAARLARARAMIAAGGGGAMMPMMMGFH